MLIAASSDWSSVRSALGILTWVTLAIGVVLAIIWIAAGGLRAYGPEDADLRGTSAQPEVAPGRRVTSFASAQLGMHAFVGLLTAILVSYGLSRDDSSTLGWATLLAAVVLTATLGAVLFRKWQRRSQPSRSTPRETRRVEDRLPRVVVYLHGLGAIAVVVLLVVLLVGDR